MDLAGDRNQSIQQWEQLFKKTREVGGEKIDVMLTDIAKDMKLTKERSLAL